MNLSISSNRHRTIYTWTTLQIPPVSKSNVMAAANTRNSNPATEPHQLRQYAAHISWCGNKPAGTAEHLLLLAPAISRLIGTLTTPHLLYVPDICASPLQQHALCLLLQSGLALLHVLFLSAVIFVFSLHFLCVAGLILLPISNDAGNAGSCRHL